MIEQVYIQGTTEYMFRSNILGCGEQFYIDGDCDADSVKSVLEEFVSPGRVKNFIKSITYKTIK